MATDVTAEIERKLVAGTAAERIEALDVLTHALDFTRPDDALTTWRLALHRHVVTDRAIASLDALVEYLVDRYAGGDHDAASRICDCLDHIATSTHRVPDRAG